MTRKEERAQLDALIETVGTFGQLNHREKNQLISKLLDGGFRYNPTILREAADAMLDRNPLLPAAWLNNRATTMEDTLCLN
ncbi:MAG TPA: hypothetical protein VF867_19665 [Arthrobacter sp.]